MGSVCIYLQSAPSVDYMDRAIIWDFDQSAIRNCSGYLNTMNLSNIYELEE